MGLKKEESTDLGLTYFTKEDGQYRYTIEAYKRGGSLSSSYTLSQEDYNLLQKIQSNFNLNKKVEEAPRGLLDLFSHNLLRYADIHFKLKELKRFHELYPEATYPLYWISDCYVLLDDIPNAVKYYPRAPLGSCSSHGTDCLLSLKYAINMDIEAMDVMSLNGPKITKWGKENINLVVQYLDIQLNEIWKDIQGRLLDRCFKEDMWSGKYPLFNGSPFNDNSEKYKIYAFSHSYTFIDLMRDAENTAREESGIPKVGEGWIAETDLFHKLKKHYAHLKVIHHGKPTWLGKQHLDIYFPDVNVAVEYQGLQHDEPVEYFGGEEAFKQTVKRDKKKLRLCEKNECKLFYVKAGYKFNELVVLIDEHIQIKKKG